MRSLSVCGLMFLWLTGCATYSSWEPTVDPRGPHAETLVRDKEECKQLAKESAGDQGNKAAIGTLVGAAVGAAGGAVIGAAAGSAGTGAAVGAAAGGLGGGAYEGLGANEDYKKAYRKCLEGRGHRVLN